MVRPEIIADRKKHEVHFLDEADLPCYELVYQADGSTLIIVHDQTVPFCDYSYDRKLEIRKNYCYLEINGQVIMELGPGGWCVIPKGETYQICGFEDLPGPCEVIETKLEIMQEPNSVFTSTV